MVRVLYQDCEKGMQSCRKIFHVDWLSPKSQMPCVSIQESRVGEQRGSLLREESKAITCTPNILPNRTSHCKLLPPTVQLKK